MSVATAAAVASASKPAPRQHAQQDARGDVAEASLARGLALEADAIPNSVANLRKAMCTDAVCACMST